MADEPRDTVLVVVPTLGVRTNLPELLRTLSHSDCNVLVLDTASAPSAQAREGASASAASYEWLGAVGLAAARNAALDRAVGYDFLAFIDDDEIPPKDWPRCLVRVAREHHAAVTFGPVVPTLGDAARPWWLARADLLRTQIESGEGVWTGDVYSGNTLLDMPTITDLNVRFRANPGFEGGEDTVFFREVTAIGCTVAWAPSSGVGELQDASRLTLRGQLSRHVQSGRLSWVLERRNGVPATRLALRRTGRLAGGIAMVGAGIPRWSSDALFVGLRDIAFATGSHLQALRDARCNATSFSHRGVSFTGARAARRMPGRSGGSQ